jgi:hypothetical protein
MSTRRAKRAHQHRAAAKKEMPESLACRVVDALAPVEHCLGVPQRRDVRACAPCGLPLAIEYDGQMRLIAKQLAQFAGAIATLPASA